MFINKNSTPNAKIYRVTPQTDERFIDVVMHSLVQNAFSLKFSVAADHPVAQVMVPGSTVSVSFNIQPPAADSDGLGMDEDPFVSPLDASSPVGTGSASAAPGTPPTSALLKPTSEETAAIVAGQTTSTLEELGCVASPGMPAIGINRTKELLGIIGGTTGGEVPTTARMSRTSIA